MVAYKNAREELHFGWGCGIMGRVMEMDQKKEWPQRKRMRLKNYDYSQNGAYFITVCVKDRKPILSKIVGDDAHIVPYEKN